MTDNSETNIKRKLTVRIITIIVLAICLFITTFALVSSIWVRDNTFRTGEVDISITGVDDGKIIDYDKTKEFLFEPGMTVVKPAIVTNNGTWPVYCKLYFVDVDGGLADILEVTIKDGNTVLYTGKASAFSKENAAVTGLIIEGEENRKTYDVIFHYPEEAGNAGQGSWLSFTMEAEAVQSKNNDNKLFE